MNASPQEYQIRKPPSNQDNLNPNPNPNPTSNPKPEIAPKPRKRGSQQTETIDQILLRISNDFSDVQPITDLSQLLKVHTGYIILSIFTLLFLPIIIGFCSPFFVGLLGTLYPGYMSIKAIGLKKERDNVKQWLSYWVLFAMFELLDGLLLMLFSYFMPFYYPLKALLLIWLFYPKSQGASLVYEKALRSLYKKIKDLREDIQDPTAEAFFKTGQGN